MRALEDIQRDIRKLIEDSFAGRLSMRESEERMMALREERAGHPDYPAYLANRREQIESDKASGAYEKRRLEQSARLDAAIGRDFR